MPILQRIELANFLNSDRVEPWRPTWPHQILEINGENAALNIPNGKGKSTMTTGILSMLTHNSKSLKTLRENAFAPPQSGHYTHIRVQVLIPMMGSGGGDLVSDAGGDIGGKPMVFGMYGNRGENERLELYAYQGTFEDAPVAHVHQHHHTLVSNDEFLGLLKGCNNLFPSNAKERTKRAWLAFVEDFFDMSSLKQQIVYQLMRGAEGGHSYFDVKPPTGMDYSAAVFYERLAPELLTDVMGELGEEGEHGIEDTIHEKVSKVIAAKHVTERKAEELRRAGNTLKELSGLLESGAKLKEAKQTYDEHRKGFSVEAAVLRDVVVDSPIPGVPRTPPEDVPAIARAMVLQDGQWFLPDRVMAEFTGEPASEANRRAQDRNGLHVAQASKSQLIDFACHSFSAGKRGPSGSLYARESALGLLKITNNFTKDWTRDKALEAVTQAFDWVESHADTNPARALKKQAKVDLAQKDGERDKLRDSLQAYATERANLITEQGELGDRQAEYRRMVDSKLFSEDEMKFPVKTGKAVTEALALSGSQLTQHKDKVRDLSGVYVALTNFVREYGDAVQPGALAAEIDAALESAKSAAEVIKNELHSAREKRKPLEKAKGDAEKRFDAVENRLKRYLETLPASIKFAEMFGTVSPVGMAQKVVDDRDKAVSRLDKIKNERDRYRESLGALLEFRAAHGNAVPQEWMSQQLAKYDSLGGEIGKLKNDLNEANLRRAALDQAVIVAGRVAREAAKVAGGKHVPLHDAVASMNLEESRREKILTLFSALLHTPVYQSVNEAAEAARRLADANIEAPVFAYPELSTFCQEGEISLDSISSHTWLVGVRTRQVDCLLDEALVEREKESADLLIQSLTESIGKKETERGHCSPESAAVSLARKASEAVKNEFEEKDAVLASEQETLETSVPDLKAKATSESLEVIRQAERHHKEFKDIAESDLRAEHQSCGEAAQAAIAALEGNESQIWEAEQRHEEHQKALSKATIAADKTDGLREIQDFIDHPTENPAFMASAGETEKILTEVCDHADRRSRFQFELVEQFIKQGYDRPQQIINRLTHIDEQDMEIRNKLIPAVEGAIKELQDRDNQLIKQVMEVDEFVRNLIRKYRDFAGEQDDIAPVSREQIERHPLGGAAIGLRCDASLSDQVKMLLDIASDIELDESAGLKADMNEARNLFRSAKQVFESKVDNILVMADLDISEPVRLELQRAKDSPSVVEHLHAVAAGNFERNTAANKTATDYLEQEWGNIGKWLKAFTQRLPDNLRTMKDVFGPLKDKDTGSYISAGFEIEAKIADQDDVKAILDDVVKMVEKFETTKRVLADDDHGLRDNAIRNVRAQIRNTFYQRVILSPRVRVYMPSIAHRPLPLQKDMVSTGQGVAMTLLWIVKMADYVTERELRRVTTSRAQQQRLHPTQFAIMDGAFSSLSNKDLIRDALDSIKRTRGRFQLIITGHDENYRNNFEYFPTLIEAREIDGRFMYADSQTRRLLQPEEVGSHYGALGVMNLRVKPIKGATAAGT